GAGLDGGYPVPGSDTSRPFRILRDDGAKGTDGTPAITGSLLERTEAPLEGAVVRIARNPCSPRLLTLRRRALGRPKICIRELRRFIVRSHGHGRLERTLRIVEPAGIDVKGGQLIPQCQVARLDLHDAQQLRLSELALALQLIELRERLAELDRIR